MKEGYDIQTHDEYRGKTPFLVSMISFALIREYMRDMIDEPVVVLQGKLMELKFPNEEQSQESRLAARINDFFKDLKDDKRFKTRNKVEIKMLKDIHEKKEFVIQSIETDIGDLTKERDMFLRWFDILGISLVFASWALQEMSHAVEERFMSPLRDKIRTSLIELREKLIEKIELDASFSIEHKDKIGVILGDGKIQIQHPNDPQQSIDLEDTCAICLSEWVQDRISTQPDSRICFASEQCKHAFHCGCIKRWYKNGERGSCPLCRKKIAFPFYTVPFKKY